jgi:Na+-translocating ferredoxin:NAD+ oxidoreductase RnfD subunit
MNPMIPAQVVRTTFWGRITDRQNWIVPDAKDPRWLIALFLALYVALGHTLLSFSRSPREIIIGLVTCLVLDVLYTYVQSRRFLFPLSAIISGLGLAVLLTAPGADLIMFITAWLTITSKYLVTYRGRHIFNPTNFSMVVILLLSGGSASVAPSYQWGGYWQVTASVIVLGLILVHRADRLPLVLAFWLAFAVSAAIRARMTHVPIEITLGAAASGGAFMLFSFFMITDPRTSPSSRGGMMLYGAGIGAIDFFFQLQTAVFSFFYALFVVCMLRTAWLMWRERATRPTPAPVPSAQPV